MKTGLKFACGGLLAIAALVACQPEGDTPTAPDMIVLNADVYTVEEGTPRASAFAVTEGRFSAVGTSEAIRALAGEATEIVDAAGRSVLPGFIDSHTHISGTAPVIAGVDLSYIVEKSDWLARIAEADARLPKGEWLSGGYWDHTLSDGVFPTRQMLDSVVRDRPVLLSHN